MSIINVGITYGILIHFYFIKTFIDNPYIKISGLPRKKCLATPLIKDKLIFF